MTEQTIEAPPIEALAAPQQSLEPARPSLSRLARKYRWVVGAAALLLLSLLIVLWARTRPGYDPYGWLVWGKLTLHFKLDTNGAPSWKPLPFLLTLPFSAAGHYSLWLWMVASVAISLCGPLFAWRIAFRLTRADPRRRYAAYAAGLFAAVFVLALSQYTHYVFSAESDTMIVSICLAAIDCHLSGKHRWAFWVWWLGALGRPEVWLFFGLSGLWLWRSMPSYRRWVATGFALIPVLWLGIPGLTSKSFLTAGNIAQHSPRALHSNKITGTIDRFLGLEAAPVWIAAFLTVAWGAYRRDREILLLAGGAIAWVVIEIAFVLHGWPGVPRYLFEPAAVAAALAGVFAGRVILDVPSLVARIVRRLGPLELGARSATLIGGWGAAVVVAVFAASMLPAARTQARFERSDLAHERVRTVLFNRLSSVVNRIGPSRILACGQPHIPIAYQSVLAWYMDIKIGQLYVSPTDQQLRPHPLVNMYPIRGGGWKVFPSHVTAASATRCNPLLLIYRP